jgi:hypothetical protein
MGIFGKEEPVVIEVNGRPLRCVVCQHDTFYRRSAVLSGAAASFFNLDWASPSCVCLVCSGCGHIHWFLPT